MKGWSIRTIFLSTNQFHMGKYYDLIVGFPSFKPRWNCVETYDVCRIVLLCHKTDSSTVFKHTVPDTISTITVLKQVFVRGYRPPGGGVQVLSP
jgi:hypothetical protein